MKPFIKLLTMSCAAAVLASCGAAPRGAALQQEIVGEAKSDTATFQLVAMNDQKKLAQVKAWPMTGQGLNLNWPGKGQSQTSRALRSGDIIDMVIWDNTPNSLIATPTQKQATMNGMEISPAGKIFVPYIDEVIIAGKTPEAAREAIQERLSVIAPASQVQLTVREGDQNTIELVSGVAKPGRYPIATKGVTILSTLAASGGIPDGMRNAVVRLQRAGKSYAVLASDLYRNPAHDIMLRGGDRIAVESDHRTFVILGAAGAEQSVAFTKADHTLLEAVSMAGGLQEGRADLRAVMVLRAYPVKALRQDTTGPNKENMVFSFDLSTGIGLFNARNFRIHPDDVVLATESPLPSTQSILGLFGATVGNLSRLNDF